MASPAEVAAMRRAMQLAARGGSHPNPCVGAVILDDRGVVGEGATERWPGTGHAETVALTAAGHAASGATMVVTLEPCNHTGRTTPCVEAILDAGIARVVVGVEDPDERASGSGIEALRGSGVDVEVGLLVDEIRALDPAYFHHRSQGLPLVILKTALTLDGQVAAVDGTSQWITSPDARQDAHRLRARFDAVMVGAGTVRADDPGLTVRLPDYTEPQPTAIVVAGEEPLPPKSKVLARPETVVASVGGRHEGPVTLAVPGAGGRVDPRGLLAALGESGFLSILVEGGPTLSSALWNAGVVAGGVFFVAGRIAGGVGRPVFGGIWSTLEDARPVRIDHVEQVGSDTRITWSTVQEGGEHEYR